MLIFIVDAIISQLYNPDIQMKALSGAQTSYAINIKTSIQLHFHNISHTTN